jgi:cytochrome c2
MMMFFRARFFECRSAGHVLVPVFFSLALVGVIGALLLGVFGLPGSKILIRAIAPKPVQTETGTAPSVRQEFIGSSLYSLEANFYADLVPQSIGQGGAIANFEGGLLLVDGDGRFYYLDWVDAEATGANPRVRPLNYHAPLNGAELDEANIAGLKRDFFRVLDLSVYPEDDNYRVFVSHHYWQPEDRCFVIRVSELRISGETLFAESRESDWRTVYETSPCLPVKDLGHVFMGQESGGRLAMLDPDTLLMTVGDLQFDGTLADEMYAQDPVASYGKSILIDLSTGTSKVFTLGHRNPQGLYIAPDGRIWSTEHGPKGGDELNLLQPDKNYGWPIVTYGTQYQSNNWPRNPAQGRHDGYSPPVFAWVPSIGISNLIGVEKFLFPDWQGDLLIASLRDMTLYRARIEGDQVRFVEPILLGVRIRDLVEADDGRIFLWTGGRTVILLKPANVSSNAKLAFRFECAGCHSTRADRLYAIGPKINGAYEAEVAASDYPYSDALRSLGGIWSVERLDAFIKDPAAFAPGTSMQGGVSDPDRRRAIIEYLQWLKSKTKQ